ncbi:pyridoxamine 5'-phosphate oxidase family protein [Flexibacterium corallicola]|uniref:pyridoxamine 5'-phosphate oxidase family protein n=1 Tax=Flexibacterium corallicola TaxID=3037259 RepID=UPI00286F2117|nr:pyridoxamine 5'-phosphate oxidase family protein [Pseudovibrio sp. M1P-2-3]
MANSTRLNQTLIDFIKKQHMFFVATAAPEGRVNMSPKGLDSLRILSPTHIRWLNLTGSGNETAAHIRQSNRMTLMFCAFNGNPMTLRVYGKATVSHSHDADWEEKLATFPELAGTRQIFDLEIDLVHISCGKGVPEMEFAKDRAYEQLEAHFINLGPEETKAYQKRKNTKSLDGFPTGILGED